MDKYARFFPKLGWMRELRVKGALAKFILFTGRRLGAFNGKNPDEVVVAGNYVRREEAQMMVQESRGGRRGWGPGTERPSSSKAGGGMALDRDRGSRMVCVVHKCAGLVLELMKSSQLMACSYYNTSKLVYHKDDFYQLKTIPFLDRLVFRRSQIHKLKG